MLERSVGDHPWRRAIARAGVDYRVLYNLRHSYTTLMIRAGWPLQWIAHQLGHVGVKKIDEVYGRWTRTPEEEALDLDAFFLEIMRLPKTALALQPLPNLSQAVDIRSLLLRKVLYFQGILATNMPRPGVEPELLSLS